jgi:hypothetical protein
MLQYGKAFVKSGGKTMGSNQSNYWFTLLIQRGLFAVKWSRT